jgi:hypothetical protein
MKYISKKYTKPIIFSPKGRLFLPLNVYTFSIARNVKKLIYSNQKGLVMVLAYHQVLTFSPPELQSRHLLPFYAS